MLAGDIKFTEAFARHLARRSRDMLLKHPNHSRQWVLRRLQRALTLDLAAAAFEHGIARATRTARRSTIAGVAAGTAERASVVSSLIGELGSAPYSSIGLARGCAQTGGVLLGWIGPWAWRPALTRLAEHTLSEYDVLVALVDGAAGIDVDLVPRLKPLLESANHGLESLTTP